MFLDLICFQKRGYKTQLLLWFHHHHLCLRNNCGKIFQSPLRYPCIFLDNDNPAHLTASCTCITFGGIKAGYLADQTNMPAWIACFMHPLACCLNVTILFPASTLTVCFCHHVVTDSHSRLEQSYSLQQAQLTSIPLTWGNVLMQWKCSTLWSSLAISKKSLQ